jgi:hypothetical protein
VSTAEQVRALAAFLPGFAPIWETDAAGRDRLVFLAPSLIARYKELSRKAGAP